jgi:type I restriction-modification system DNA methylase subunit
MLLTRDADSVIAAWRMESDGFSSADAMFARYTPLMSEAVEAYLRGLSEKRNTGATTKERSYYGVLENLLAAVGAKLAPKVLVVGELQGEDHPDFGLFTQNQTRGKKELKGQKPERGVVEVKSTGEEVIYTSKTKQVSKYWDQHRLVVVTNYRDFLLVGEDEDGKPAALEPFRIGKSEDEFWKLAGSSKKTAESIGTRLDEYLRRVLSYKASIKDPKDIAWFLASYARDALSRVEAQKELPGLASVRADLEEALGIKFEGPKGEHFFRSTLVQTLFYGLFSGWVLWARDPQNATKTFDWRTTPWHLQLPVLRSLFEKVGSPTHLKPLKLDEMLSWASAALDRVDTGAFFSTFQEGHAVQYFYEPFLEAYDPGLRKELGVWYTPHEVVQYMVARVDRVLRDQLKIKNGLANEQVVVLDPCTGTGSFMVEVLRNIEATLREQGDDATAALEVKKAATTRIFGFEIMPAPFVVAHLQIGLHLKSIGAPLDTAEERAQVFLTNALTGWEPPDEKKQRVLPASEFQQEKAAADRVKQKEKILVIIGNPPYNGFAGLAMEEERTLSDAYREVKRVRPPEGQGLNDLYVRFYRMAERRIAERSGVGVVCFISNYSWLDGLSFTGMREHYLDVFDDIAIDCLNGDKYKTGKKAPDGKSDPSIFSTTQNREGIQVGTAIALLARNAKHEPSTNVRFRHFWGTSKLEQLAAAAKAKNQVYMAESPSLALGLPFLPLAVGAHYPDWPLLVELLPKSFPGVKTSRDSAVVSIDRDTLLKNIGVYLDSSIPEDQLRQLFPAAMEKAPGFDPSATRRYLSEREAKHQASKEESFFPRNVVRYLYRPFDLRWIYWEPETKLLDRNRPDYWPHVFDGNRWLSASQRNRKVDFYAPQATGRLADHHIVESNIAMFPLRLRGDVGSHTTPRPNISPEARSYLDGVAGDETALFNHILATLHSPLYGKENAGALRQDWPRIPLANTSAAVLRSSVLGERLAALLNPETAVDGVTEGKLSPEFRGLGTPRRVDGQTLKGGAEFEITADWGRVGVGGACMPGNGKVTERPWTLEERQVFAASAGGHQLADGKVFELLGETAVDVWLNGEVFWAAVPMRVWEYTLGGYPVLKKWLSYREKALLGRALRLEEVKEVSAIVRRIAGILLMQPALDANYIDIRDNSWPWPRKAGTVPLPQAPASDSEDDAA